MNLLHRVEEQNRQDSHYTETSILFILNVLFSCYFSKEYEKNLKYKIEQGVLLETPRWINSGETEWRTEE